MDETVNVQQRKNKEKPKEKGVTEKPKRFLTQEMARRFSLFEEVLFVFEGQDPDVEWYMKVAAAIAECNPKLPCHL